MNHSDLLHDAKTLRCPGCRGEYLHHKEVALWNRDAEDDKGKVIRVDTKAGVTSADAIAGFVGRRDDVRVSFSCEGCDRISTLVIWQHKGQTLISWDVPGAPLHT